MPGLRLHMKIARDIAGELDSKLIDAERGAYYLGATTPDIRALTRWDRARTHFFDLNYLGEQSGVHRLFEEQPALRDASALDARTASFLSGYLSHLVMDEDYICRIYRPLFGERSELAGDVMADFMDKALQWDIERRDCGAQTSIDEIRRALAEASVEVSVDFIARDTLAQWRDRSRELLATAPSVERLVRFLGRRIPALGVEDDESVARVAEQVPGLLERTWEHVGEERVREYLHDSTLRARHAIEEYLS